MAKFKTKEAKASAIAKAQEDLKNAKQALIDVSDQDVEEKD
jgi:hypothetical protein